MKLRPLRTEPPPAKPPVVDYMLLDLRTKREQAPVPPRIPEKPRRTQTPFAKKFTKKRLGIIAALLVVALIGTVYGFTHIGYASTTQFYPTSCLGSWQDTQHAAGTPDVANQDERDAFTPDNSSVVSNTLGNIYCGGFDGKIPAETHPTKITVHFSWTVKGSEQAAEAPAATPAATSTDASDASSTGTGTSPDGNSTSAPDSASGASGAQPASSDAAPANAPAPTPAPADVPASAAPAPASDAPTSIAPMPADQSLSLRGIFRELFYQPALAQDVPATDASATAAVPEAATSSENQDITLPLPPSAPPGALLAVRYTTDGIVWKDLGTVTKDQMTGATFDVPTAGLESWEDLSKLQISVQTLSSIDAPTIYLDSEWLSIDYADALVKPDHPMVFTDLSTGAKATTLRTHDDETPDQKLIIASITGNLNGVAIYQDVSPGAPFLHTYVEDTYYIVAASGFPAGSYSVITTNDPNHCANQNLDACAGDPQATDQVTFRVASSTASTAASTTPPDNLSSSTPEQEATTTTH